MRRNKIMRSEVDLRAHVRMTGVEEGGWGAGEGTAKKVWAT